MVVAGLAAAAITISNESLEGEVIANENIRHVSITGSDVTSAAIGHAGIRDSHVAKAHVFRASVENSYMEHLTLEHASATDTRVAFATLDAVTLTDATLCFAAVADADYRTGQCAVVSKPAGGDVTEHAWLHADAPDVVAPGESFDLEVEVADSGTLTVTNDPAGLTALAFDPTAADSSIASLEVWSGGEMMGEFGLGESFDLAGVERFSLRVNVAESGIIDGSTLGLVLDVNGHGLRTAMTTFDVVATQLAFAPIEGQAFAPFLADNVARLVISVATDDNGNVDRDLDVAYSVDVESVDSGAGEGGPTLSEEVQHHAGLHGDAEFFSENPIGYSNPTSDAAHHPATLEFILRDQVGVEGITYGAANFYATHLVVQSPYHTEVTVHAQTENAEGEMLEAAPIDIQLTRLPEDERPVDHPFGPFGDKVFPGEGWLRVEYVDENGDPVDREAGWTLMIQETPESHRTTMKVVYGEEDSGSVDVQPLASTPPVGLPFGDFVPHEYKVCLHYDGKESCANDGDLVAIQTGETTTVQIVVE